MALPARGPVRSAFLAGALLHALAALWIWSRYSSAARALVLFWADFPASLAYAGLGGGRFLAASLLVGSLLWGAVAALLAALVGRVARRG
jgi:hypothetical protein